MKLHRVISIAFPGTKILIVLAAIGVVGISIPVAGQAQEIDVETQATDSRAEFDRLEAATRNAMLSEPSVALTYAVEMAPLASLLPAPEQAKAITTSKWLHAEALQRLARYDDALLILNEAFANNVDQGSLLAGELLVTRGRIARTNSDATLAFVSFQEANTIFQKHDDRRRQAVALHSLADLYNEAGQHDRVITYDTQANEIFKPDSSLEFFSLHHRAEAQIAFGDQEAGARLLEQALTLSVQMESDRLQGWILAEIALLSIDRSKFDAAQTALDNAFERMVSVDAQYWEPRIRGAQAALHLRKGNTEAAREEIEKALADIDITTGATYWYRDIAETAYEIYKTAGQSELALEYLEEFARMRLQNRDVARATGNALRDAEIQLAQNENEIEKLLISQLESDVTLTQARLRQRNIIASVVLIFGFSIFGFLVWAYYSVRKTQHITQNYNDELAAINADLLSANIDLEKANQAKMEFLATTSHEVRTPLNAIIGLTDVMLKADELNDKNHDYLEVVNTSGRNLLRILDDILDVSKLEAGRLNINRSPMEITECVLDVAELWRNVAQKKGLAFEVSVDDELGAFLCDERLIRQIISNLLANAIKFTQEGKVSLELHGADSGFTISVRDTGIGIAPEHQEVIFEMFRQADSSNERAFNGTGLGLAICKKITNALGGAISVISRPGAGAHFTVSIPAEKCDEKDGAVAVQADQSKTFALTGSENPNPLSVLRVLLAEDNPANALVTCAMLSGQVADIKVVENGAEAVRAVQERSFDVILMDKQMPVLNGVAATQEIRALPEPYCNIPIICLTAGVLPNSKAECIENGMDEYLTKPVPFTKLSVAIIDAIRTRSAIAA